nr:hypothetical protein BaRGS_034099 [Batillaria attramentaria]
MCATGTINDTTKDTWAVLRDPDPIADIFRRQVDVYCRSTLPEAMRCMRDRISGCDENTRDYILGLASDGAGLCDGLSVKSSVATALSQLPRVAPRDAGLCTHADILPCFLSECDGTSNRDFSNDRIQDIVPIVRRSYTCLAECLARVYRSNSATCPNWQFHLLLTHREVFLPVRLAVSAARKDSNGRSQQEGAKILA